MKKIISLALSVFLAAGCFTAFAENEYVDGKSGWSVTATSEKDPIARAFDDDPTSFWHSNYVVKEDGQNERDPMPYFVEITLPAVTVVSGFAYTPRQNEKSPSGRFLEYALYAASGDNDEYAKIYEGTFENDDTVKTVDFKYNIKAKKLKLEVISGVNGYATMAEFDLIKSKKDYKEIAPKDLAAEIEKKRIEEEENAIYVLGKSKWKVTASSEKPSSPITNAFDGDPVTTWHTNYNDNDTTDRDKPPYTIEITLPEEKVVSGWVYTPRQNTASKSGWILEYEIYGSDGSDTYVLLEKNTMAANSNVKINSFDVNVAVKKIKLIVLNSMNSYGTMGEFDLINKQKDYDTVKLSGYTEYKKENAIYRIDSAEFLAEATSVWNNNFGLLAFDGRTDSYWHEKPGDNPPYDLTVDMNSEHVISGFEYIPRQDDIKGHWLKFNVYAGNDKNDLTKIVDGKTFNLDFSVKRVMFPETMCRYVMFEVIEANVHCAAAEITFLQTKKAKEAEGEAEKEKYVLSVGKKSITVQKGSEITEKEIDVAPYIRNGSTLIPLRGLLEEMGATVSWNGEDKTVTVNKGATKIEFQIYNKNVNVTTGRYGKVRYPLLAPPVITESRTFIPLRFVSEHLGYNVTWDGATQTITIENIEK